MTFTLSRRKFLNGYLRSDCSSTQLTVTISYIYNIYYMVSKRYSRARASSGRARYNKCQVFCFFVCFSSLWNSKSWATVLASLKNHGTVTVDVWSQMFMHRCIRALLTSWVPRHVGVVGFSWVCGWNSSVGTTYELEGCAICFVSKFGLFFMRPPFSNVKKHAFWWVPSKVGSLQEYIEYMQFLRFLWQTIDMEIRLKSPSFWDHVCQPAREPAPSTSWAPSKNVNGNPRQRTNAGGLQRPPSLHRVTHKKVTKCWHLIDWWW